jgi:hypothetical protein
MTDDVPMRDLGDALRGWLAAREETERHLTGNKGTPLTRAWIQKLSDLLTTEHAWQEQYTGLMGSGGIGEFPESRR